MTATLAAESWVAIGTQVRVVTDDRYVADARAILENELAALDLACSRFRPDSELRRLDEAHGEPTQVSPLLAAALAVALRAAFLTDGDVDPTVGSAMHAAGYDRTFDQVPADGTRLRIVTTPVPGWRTVDLDVDRRIVTVPDGVRLDLGATAKAFAADRAAARIHASLGCGVLVSLGGDIAVAGDPPPGGWSVRVQDVTGDPDDEPVGPTSTVAIVDGGLATSSTSARRWTRGGRMLHHIIDPRTSAPAVTPWRTVSVAAASCVDANIASTASITRGKAALPWLRGLDLAARLVDVSGTVHTVAGWPEDAA